MLAGIGCDLIEIERIRKACLKEAFLLRMYTENECRQSEGRPSYLAGNFAVKEAVVKVFGTGFREITPKEIEVLRDDLGKPYVNLYGKAEEMAKKLGISRISVSITNTKDMAMAMAAGEGESR